MTVYLDLLMLLNFLIDFLLLVCAERLAGFLPAFRRISLASLLGGIFGGICVLPGFYFLGKIIWRMIFLILISIIAFGFSKAALRKGILFIFMTMALGGAASGVHAGRFGSLLGTALSVAVLCVIGFRGKTETATYIPVELEYLGKKLRITALYDTGNTLRDPVTGEQALIIGSDIGSSLFGLNPQQLEHPVETMLKPPLDGLRLIPYCAVGKSTGMLLAIRCSNVRIGNRQGSALVAFSPNKIGNEDVYQALAGGSL